MGEVRSIKQPLVDLVDIPIDIRQKTDSLVARMNGIRSTLGCAATQPEKKRAAKDSLVVLSKEALALWALL